MRWIITLFMVVVLAGCVTIKYDTKTKMVSYSRLGDQKLGGVSITLADGGSITFESQKSDAMMISEAMKLFEKAFTMGVMVGEPNDAY